jgi:hypothetical protein
VRQRRGRVRRSPGHDGRAAGRTSAGPGQQGVADRRWPGGAAARPPRAPSWSRSTASTAPSTSASAPAPTGPAGSHRLVLTASGGPVPGSHGADLAGHRRRRPGPSHLVDGPQDHVDSSTLMNKGLEVIEAHELFGAQRGSTGWASASTTSTWWCTRSRSCTRWSPTPTASTIAQLSLPDMRLPIGYALAWPDRIATAFGAIDWSTLVRLDFEPPDHDAFPCLGLAYTGRTGRGLGAGLAQRRQRGGGRGLPRRPHPVGRHRRGVRRRAGSWDGTALPGSRTWWPPTPEPGPLPVAW